MKDLSLRICRSAHFDSLESANEAFCIPLLFAELRFDLSSIAIDNIPKLEFPEKLVFTCRKGALSLSNRLKAYNLAIDMDVDYIDLDFEMDMELLLNLKSKITNSKTQLILSQHNYESTPDFEKMKESTHKAFELGADLAKIITTANSITDLDNIYHLYERFNDLIAFAMGKIGIESRAKILTLGAPFTYAAFSEKDKTAPGQMDFQQTLELYHKIKTESL
jgi:3-dehydroquinate dehydratase type I